LRKVDECREARFIESIFLSTVETEAKTKEKEKKNGRKREKKKRRKRTEASLRSLGVAMRQY